MYGAEFYDPSGNRVFDGQSCMYEKDTGSCWKFAWSNDGDINNPIKYNKSWIQSQSGSNSVGLWYWLENGGGSTFYYVYQSVSDTYTQYNTSSQIRYIMNSSASLGDISFVSIPAEGILQMHQINNALPEFPAGTNLVVSTLSSEQLGYKIFSPDIPNVTGGYGMQLFNEISNVVFDSRKQILGVEFFEITSAQSQDILLNNAVINLSLQKANPNAYVSSPLWMNYTAHSTTSGCGRWIKITQPDPYTIRLSRQSHGANVSLCDNAKSYFSDLQLLIARG